tara:strand:+ start:360 stop:518 length:159 start_codon:yes stop_codon:yes gene_type:complete
MLRKIVRQFDNSRLGRKVLTDRKNNLRNRGRVEEAPVAAPVKKKVAKKTSRK